MAIVLHKLRGMKLTTLDEREQLQFRCTKCNRRLADYVDDIANGRLLLEIKCPKCGVPNSLLVKAS